ncbi:response regulator transcription factor [Shouchella sp. 1P09AA]|uniref:response regulator transcription factor n=1 Tax=unclassified Shouchella TaxID=2893065 RepID=UPI0039A3CD6E
MSDRKKILIVDDEWTMRNLIKIYLQNNSYDVIEAKNGKEALETINREKCDLLLLDLMMPEMDGYDVCKMVRENYDIPILILSARKDWQDRVEGLNLGADDYLVKPFEPEELTARINALIRRSENEFRKGDLVFEELAIRLKLRTVSVKGNSVEFTFKEFDLLYKLASAPNRVFTRDDLLQLIWGIEYVGALRTVDSHVKNIRSKLIDAGLKSNRIETVWGVGYKFV